LGNAAPSAPAPAGLEHLLEALPVGRADEVADAVAQYSITLSSISSRVSTFSGWPSQSVQAQNFSTIQASCPTGESVSP
jgi:hypothetical protein